MAENNKINEKKRYRNFATIVYPESMADNIWETLDSLHIPIYVSPLHDKDDNKPHYHILFCFDGVKTLEQVKSLVDLIGGVGLEIVNSSRSYARYLCHIDSPDKHRYLEHDVRVFGGANYLDIISSPADKYICISDMLDFIYESNVVDFFDFLLYTKENEPVWFHCLCDNSSYLIREAIKSNARQISV